MSQKQKKTNYNDNNGIIIKGARENNLKNIDVIIPRNKLVVITGISGSGKSSLAFKTIYAEGQRRYVESLSSYARQFLGIMDKPDVDNISGLSPAISIEQKVTSNNPRSTVGTVTELHDYLRLLYGKIGTQHCFKCNGVVQRQSVQQIVDNILKFPDKSKIHVLAPIIKGKKGEFGELIKSIASQGFVRISIDEKEYNIPTKITLDKNKKHEINVVIDRIVLNKKNIERLTSSIELAIKMGNGIVIIQKNKNKYLYSENYSCLKCNLSFEEKEPRMFSFNSPYGACSGCGGLGTETSIDPELVIQDHNKSILQGCIIPLGEQPRGGLFSSMLKSLSLEYNFLLTTKWNNIDNNVKKIILYGQKKPYKIKYRSTNFQGEIKKSYEGVIPNLKRRYTQTKSRRMREWIEQFMARQPCTKCKGERLNKKSLAVKINNKNIYEISNISIMELKKFLKKINIKSSYKKIAQEITKEILTRTNFLINVGLEYLTLNRSAGSLSGGESQRIRLATQIGSQLVGVLYILDEPTIGLHQRDNERLIKTLLKLKELGNTVVIVEHDHGTMKAADWIIDLGPGAGEAGGKVVFSGTYQNIIDSKKSITGKYLSGKNNVKVDKKRINISNKKLRINGASGNNLKNINATIPLSRFICITGVSGSGKSTLINQTLYPALLREFNNSNKKPLKYLSLNGLLYIDKVININQAPIGKTPRSNPATYTGLFTHIRDLFSSLPESKARGYKPGRFSFNVKGGRCESCQGGGMIKIEMHFLSDMYIKCEECQGKRYNRETLEILYKGKTISDILNMSIDLAESFFKVHIKINKKLKTIQKVGLGYLRLGQQATTLSGGESQRVKLSTELAKVNTGKTIYLLDEPTTGLHFEDVNILLKVLHQLVDLGNTVVVIEHNLDVIKTADWIIDLGPEGGARGGEIIYEGTPQELSKIKKSHTGRFIKPHINN